MEYYTKFDEFVRDAANIPFATPLGAKLTASSIIGSPLTTPAATSKEYTVPGVMSIEFIPAIGVSNDFTSPINRSSIRFYTYLRSNQKASATYDHQDITMMEIAMDSAYMFHGLMSKIYAIENQFTPVNEYYSRATVAACWANFDDIRANMQDFRAYINAYAYSLGQYALPNGITLFDRHRWMVEGMYTDSTSTHSQTYMFVPSGFWKYDNTVSTGSECTWVPYANQLHTFAQLKQFGDALLNAISNDEDFAVISGDIYNFYGGDTYKLPYIDENYTIVPAYSEVVLSQIENLTLFSVDASTLKISQNPSVNGGAILFQPKVSTSIGGIRDLKINMHHDNVTPEDVIEATRLMGTISGAAVDDDYYAITSCGTEIVNALRIWYRSTYSGQFTSNFLTSTSFSLSTASTPQQWNAAISFILSMAQFDWAPRVELWSAENTGTSVGDYNFQGLSWDVDNLTPIADQYLSNIHLGCLLSLFKVGTNRE